MENTLNARSRSQTLVQAVKNNDITRVEELLNSGMDVNKMYPVVESAFPRRTKIVYKTLLIIACGINIYTQGDNIDMIKLLINYGADVNKHGPGLFSKPPLTECLYSRKEIIELLLKNGANPNIHSEYFRNIPLYHYVDKNEYEMVELLLKYGANPNITTNTTNNGDTPLHSCVYQGRYEIAKLLLKYGANPDIKNNNGETPYEYSKMGGYFGYSISNQKKIADFIENQKKTQEAKQNLAFMSSLNPRLGENAFNKTAYDLLEKIADVPIEYDQSVYNRKMLEERLNDLTRARQLSKTMRGMETSVGPFGDKNVKYEPNIMEGISRHLSTMRPDYSVSKRMRKQSSTNSSKKSKKSSKKSKKSKKKRR
jgi:ankyrin repeat protein